MKVLKKIKPLALFIFGLLLLTCSEPILEEAEFIVEVEQADFLRSAFFESHSGVIQIRHELAGGLDINGEERETYFMRVGGAEISVLKPESKILFGDNLELVLENGFAQTRDDSRIADLFGSDLNVEIIANENQRSNSVELELGRIPATLESNIGFIPGGLREGGTITWDPDPLYEGNVYLVAEYFPNLNDSEIADSYPVGCVEYLTIDDSNGSYSLNMADFACIPENAVVYFTFIRGVAIKIISEEEGNDILLAYSSNTALTEV